MPSVVACSIAMPMSSPATCAFVSGRLVTTWTSSTSGASRHTFSTLPPADPVAPNRSTLIPTSASFQDRSCMAPWWRTGGPIAAPASPRGKTGPPARVLDDGGVGGGLPHAGEPTVRQRRFADRRPRTHRRRREGRLRTCFGTHARHAAQGRGDRTARPPRRRLSSIRRRPINISAAAKSRRPRDAMRPARGVRSKNSLQAYRAVAALFRQCRPRNPVVQVIVH